MGSDVNQCSTGSQGTKEPHTKVSVSLSRLTMGTIEAAPLTLDNPQNGFFT